LCKDSCPIAKKRCSVSPPLNNSRLGSLLSTRSTPTSEEALLDRRVGDLGIGRSRQPRDRSLGIILDGSSGDAEPTSDLTCAHPVMGKPQHLSYLSHGQLPPWPGSPISSSLVEAWNAAVADPRETVSISATKWPASPRNRGRHQEAGLKSATSSAGRIGLAQSGGIARQRAYRMGESGWSAARRSAW
jgi:hypothetical protein